MQAALTGEWTRETHTIRAGALFVPIAQPLSRLVMGLLEPQAPDSLAAWGFFNACFEQKEHMEPYVAEQENALPWHQHAIEDDRTVHFLEAGAERMVE